MALVAAIGQPIHLQTLLLLTLLLLPIPIREFSLSLVPLVRVTTPTPPIQALIPIPTPPTQALIPIPTPPTQALIPIPTPPTQALIPPQTAQTQVLITKDDTNSGLTSSTPRVTGKREPLTTKQDEQDLRIFWVNTPCS